MVLRGAVELHKNKKRGREISSVKWRIRGKRERKEVKNKGAVKRAASKRLHALGPRERDFRKRIVGITRGKKRRRPENEKQGGKVAGW